MVSVLDSVQTITFQWTVNQQASLDGICVSFSKPMS